MAEITEIRLLRTPLENDYQHTHAFANEREQYEYFNARKIDIGTFTDCTYQRKDGTIRIPVEYDRIYMCNYVMYKNAQYSNKWYYAFVTDVSYINSGMTEFKIETDVIQTWMFDYDVKASFIEREHCNDDTYGLHTINESLETGEYICTYAKKAGITTSGTFSASTDLTIVVGVTYKVEDERNVSGNVYNGIYSGLKYYFFDNTTLGISQLNGFLNDYAEHAKADSITNMFLVPSSMINKEGKNNGAIGASYDPYRWDVGDTQLVGMPNDIDGYTPRNKKLLTFPYRYLNVCNNRGKNAIYHFEKFWTGKPNHIITTPKFYIYGSITPGCSIRLVPRNYNGGNTSDFGASNEDGLNLGKFPVCNWNTDVYINWLAQNEASFGLNIVKGVVNFLGGADLVHNPISLNASVTGGQMMIQGAMGIADTIMERYQHSLNPPQSEGNTDSGDVTTSLGLNDFTFYYMTIKREYAQIIDGFFDMYGYKTSIIKVPNKFHRERWWYTKTINVNVDGNIPQADLQKIKNIYNNGITFWRSHVIIGDYSLSNNIVTQ